MADNWTLSAPFSRGFLANLFKVFKLNVFRGLKNCPEVFLQVLCIFIMIVSNFKLEENVKVLAEFSDNYF